MTGRDDNDLTMFDGHTPRFSDAKLEEFYQQFIAHCRTEERDRKQQQEMFDALFRQEDLSRNIAAGVVQLMVRTAGDVKALRIAADRQKTFIGGVLFAITAIWFLLTDVGPVLVDKLKKFF